MTVLHISTVSLAVSLILGCSSGQDAHPQGAAAPPAAKTVFDPLTQDLQKARGVQNIADANADASRAAVDHEERGDSPP